METSNFISHNLTSTTKIILYLLENDIHKYILFVSTYAVQLWQLEADVEDKNSMTTKIFFKNPRYGTEGHLDFLSSTLIYTRSYYELNYEESTPNLTVQDKKQYGRPHVQFLENKGHIFVYVPI
jgi:hypothetical protein